MAKILFRILILISILNHCNGMQWRNPKNLKWLSAIAVARQTKPEEIWNSEKTTASDLDGIELKAITSILMTAEKKKPKKTADPEFTRLIHKYKNVLGILKEAFVFVHKDNLPKFDLETYQKEVQFRQLEDVQTFALNDNLIAYLHPVENKVHIIDIKEGKKRRLLLPLNSKNISTIGIDKASSKIIAHDNNIVYVFDFKEHKGLNKITVQKGIPSALNLSHGGNYAAAGLLNGTIFIKNLLDKSDQSFIDYRAHTGPVYSVAFDKNSNLLVSGGADSQVCVWDWKNKQLLIMWKSDQPVLTTVFDNLGKFVIYGNKNINIRDWSDDVDLIKITEDPEQIYSIYFDDAEKQIIACFKGGFIKRWKDPIKYRYLQISIPAFFYIFAISKLEHHYNSQLPNKKLTKEILIEYKERPEIKLLDDVVSQYCVNSLVAFANKKEQIEKLNLSQEKYELTNQKLPYDQEFFLQNKTQDLNKDSHEFQIKDLEEEFYKSTE